MPPWILSAYCWGRNGPLIASRPEDYAKGRHDLARSTGLATSPALPATCIVHVAELQAPRDVPCSLNCFRIAFLLPEPAARGIDSAASFIDEEHMNDSSALLDATSRAEVLDRLAREINEHLTRGAVEWIKAGGKLAEARGRCVHGEWGPWLKRNFRWTHKTALTYIDMHRRFGDKIETVSDLPGKVLRLLAKPSTSREAIDDLLKRKEAGEEITPQLVRATIWEREAPQAPPITVAYQVSDSEPVKTIGLRESARLCAEQLKARRVATEAAGRGAFSRHLLMTKMTAPNLRQLYQPKSALRF
jgi:hypothetical protein